VPPDRLPLSRIQAADRAAALQSWHEQRQRWNPAPRRLAPAAARAWLSAHTGRHCRLKTMVACMLPVGAASTPNALLFACEIPVAEPRKIRKISNEIDPQFQLQRARSSISPCSRVPQHLNTQSDLHSPLLYQVDWHEVCGLRMSAHRAGVRRPREALPLDVHF